MNTRLLSHYAARPVLTLTLLCCTVVMSACYEGACGLLGPGLVSSDASSHGTTDLSVRVRYRNEDVLGPETVTVTGGGSSLTVRNGTSDTMTVRGLTKGDSVVFSVPLGGVILRACTWSGRVGLLYDATLDISVDVFSSRPSVYCVGW